jgi:DNA-binding transcriptional ArsR family regulator
MDPFTVLADPTRRRILEILASRERSAGEVTVAIQAEAGVSQSAVSQHLGVLRDSGFATVRVEAQRRIYRTDAAALRMVAAWLDQVMPTFEQQLDALATEVARGKRARRRGVTGRGDTDAMATDAGADARPA